MSVTHLHCLYKNVGPRALVGLTSGFALCGARDLPREHLTAFPDDATCTACLERHRAPPLVPAPEPEPEHKPRRAPLRYRTPPRNRKRR